MGHFEQNPWGESAKQKRAHGEIPLTPKQELARRHGETADDKEYDFSGAESVFGGVSDVENEPERDGPIKH